MLKRNITCNLRRKQEKGTFLLTPNQVSFNQIHRPWNSFLDRQWGKCQCQRMGEMCMMKPSMSMLGGK
jgi:hypothetical protein